MNKSVTPKNDKGKPHGLWERYWWNETKSVKCVYINGKPNGFGEQYSWCNNGKVTEKIYYL